MAHNGQWPPPRESDDSEPGNRPWHAPHGAPGAPPPQGPPPGPPPGNTLPYTIAAPGGDPLLAPGGPGGMPSQGMPPRNGPAPRGMPPGVAQPPQPGHGGAFPPAVPPGPVAGAEQAAYGPPDGGPYPPGPYPPQGRPGAGPHPPQAPSAPAAHPGHGQSGGGPYPPPGPAGAVPGPYGGPAPQAPFPPPPGPPGPAGPYPPIAHPFGAPGHVPRRRGSTAGAAVGGVLGMIAGLFVVLVVAVNVLGEDDGRPSVSPVTLPSVSPFDLPRTDVGARRTPRAVESRATNRSSPRATPRGEVGDSVGRPGRARTVNRTLRGNTVYRMGALPAVRCPAGTVNIYNHAQLKGLILRTGACLNRGWGPALERVGIAHAPPRYAIAAGRGRGACGDYPPRGSIVPYYCPRNTTIYASTSAMARGTGTAPGYGELTSWHGAIISMMAHEYGHHVQYLTGLTDAWWRQTLESGSQDTRLALSRRLELQATCFGGMFMRSVAGTYPVPPARRELLYAFYSRVGDHPGYPRDHGSPANNHRWFRQGFEQNRTQQCNTWRASAVTVS